ncbi:uncharacterized protein PAC_18132 [Phialocephala subalpina]|uniref:Uncharacterized protein n=1 Tax=Phialocephala subalpina TaxID=576137 RepID=A0A1L7XT66_9HELO|nr:uncharacterized protein PAC_18132 [Phialocephala subalpina]
MAGQTLAAPIFNTLRDYVSARDSFKPRDIADDSAKRQDDEGTSSEDDLPISDAPSFDDNSSSGEGEGTANLAARQDDESSSSDGGDDLPVPKAPIFDDDEPAGEDVYTRDISTRQNAAAGTAAGGSSSSGAGISLPIPKLPTVTGANSGSGNTVGGSAGMVPARAKNEASRLLVLHHMFGSDFRMLARVKISRCQSYTTSRRYNSFHWIVRCYVVFVYCWKPEGDDLLCHCHPAMIVHRCRNAGYSTRRWHLDLLQLMNTRQP